MLDGLAVSWNLKITFGWVSLKTVCVYFKKIGRIFYWNKSKLKISSTCLGLIEKSDFFSRLRLVIFGFNLKLFKFVRLIKLGYFTNLINFGRLYGVNFMILIVLCRMLFLLLFSFHVLLRFYNPFLFSTRWYSVIILK